MTYLDLQAQRLAVGDPDTIVRDMLERRIKTLEETLTLLDRLLIGQKNAVSASLRAIIRAALEKPHEK